MMNEDKLRNIIDGLLAQVQTLVLEKAMALADLRAATQEIENLRSQLESSNVTNDVDKVIRED